jgi:Mrp family chromosome partitioning ATPase
VAPPATPPVEPYFPKPVPIVGASFAGTLMLVMLVILLRELFSGRALRAAPGAGFARVEDVGPTPIPAAAAVAAAADPAPMGDAGSAGELSVADAVGKLIAANTARAVFVSPEGDEAVAASVLVAREVSDAGLRAILIDLTRSGAASLTMLESGAYQGITDLLCSQAQFSDVIHADLYSDCHIIPVGNADMGRATRSIDRLPIILSALATAYDIVIVECGPTGADGIRRVVDEETVIFVGALKPQDESVVATARELSESGFEGVMLVSPEGNTTPPSGGRNAA